jgi:hypothetical protein
MDERAHSERDQATARPDETLPAELVAALDLRGIPARDEVGLRRELERHLSGYTLYRLTPAAARRWKCKYRIMFGATYFDCQTVPEAYARALLAALEDGAGGG